MEAKEFLRILSPSIDESIDENGRVHVNIKFIEGAMKEYAQMKVNELSELHLL